MIYQIVTVEPIKNTKGTKVVGHDFIPQKHYSSMKSAERKIIKSYSHRDTKIVLIPDEITVGLVLYKSDGDIYGEIVMETEYFFYIKRPDYEDPSVFIKENFKKIFYSGDITIKEAFEGV